MGALHGVEALPRRWREGLLGRTSEDDDGQVHALIDRARGEFIFRGGDDLMSAFASVWRAAEKVVYSTSMTAVSTARTRLERRFDPAAVRDMLAAAPGDVLVGGPNLAAQALEAGPVDECRLIVWPVILGGRNPALSARGRIDLALLDEHRFANGVVHLRYRVRSR